MMMSRKTAFLEVALVFLLILGLAAGPLVAYLADVTKALYPDAPGKTVYSGSGVTIDASNASEGYVMIKASSKKKLKLRVVKGDMTLTYDLPSGDYQTIPLQAGSGTYQATVYQQVRGSQYSQLYSKKIKAELPDETRYALYPNQYVPYTDASTAVEKGRELCEGLQGDQEKAKAVIDYITGTVLYDHLKAKTVESGYLPDVDSTLDSKKGICFDYSALVACMLRTQGVKCKLVIGYADKFYHAWNEVLLGGNWVRYDTTSMVTGLKVVTYTTERVY
jgi:transglutaminase-like putative cysteine protease